MRRWVGILVIGAAILSHPVNTAAQTLRFDGFRRGQKQFTLSSGYGGNHRIPSDIPKTFSFDVFKARYGWFTSPRTEIGVDFYYENLNGGSSNHSLSSTVSYRRYFLVRGSTTLAYDLGVGLTRFDRKIVLLGTSTNFTELLGLTFEHGLGPASAIVVQYGFTHTSNAGMGSPNIGLNASAVGIGISWFP